MFYIDKKNLKREFNLNSNIINNLLRVQIFYKNYYCISYDQKIYDRFIKIMKLAPNKTIDKYIKIIDYSRDHDLNFKDIMSQIGMINIDEHIIENVMKLSSKKQWNRIESISF